MSRVKPAHCNRRLANNRTAHRRLAEQACAGIVNPDRHLSDELTTSGVQLLICLSGALVARERSVRSLKGTTN